MMQPKVFANATLTTLTVLSLGILNYSASAAPTILVTRGSHGAIAIVDKVPSGATALPTTPSQGYPTIVTRGHGGAAYITDQPKQDLSMAPAHTFPKLMTNGSHGAANLVK